jgi:hypothetical protein
MKAETWKTLAVNFCGGEFRYRLDGEPLAEMQEAGLLQKLIEAYRDRGILPFGQTFTVDLTWIIRGRAVTRQLHCVYAPAGAFPVDEILGDAWLECNLLPPSATQH